MNKEDSGLHLFCACGCSRGSCRQRHCIGEIKPAGYLSALFCGGEMKCHTKSMKKCVECKVPIGTEGIPGEGRRREHRAKEMQKGGNVIKRSSQLKACKLFEKKRKEKKRKHC
jgi:hypothetical protein